MTATRPITARYSDRRPCPVCGAGSKSCSATDDGMQLCRGEPTEPSQWTRITRVPDAAGFEHYRRADDDRGLRNGHHHAPPPSRDWTAEAKRYAAALTEDRREALARSLGLPAESIAVLDLVGWSDQLGAWTFPERDGTGRIIGITTRTPDGSKKAITGSARGLSIPAGWQNRPGPIVIGEGVSDTIAGSLCGVAIIDRPSNTGGADALASLLRNVPADRAIAVLAERDAKPDGSWPGKQGAEAVAAKLGAALQRTVNIAFPPEGIKDAREWVHELAAGQGEAEDWSAIGVDILRAIEAQRPTPKTLPLLYFDDITPALDASDFVEGLLIDGAMSVVYGDSNTGKTFFVLDLALHVASGVEWRGRAVDRRGVLYLALEGSHGISNRVAAFKLVHQVRDLPFVVVPIALDLLDPTADTIRVIEAAKVAASKLGIPVGLIVVDTLSRAIAGGNENSPDDMGALVRNIDIIRQELPAHVAIVHHSGKDTAKGARGHSLLRAATDTEIEVTRDAESGVSTARVTKQREMDCEGEFGFRLESVVLGVNRRGKSVTSCVVREAEANTPEVNLTPTEKAALRELSALITESGTTGVPGVPPSTPSVLMDLWRHRFYERCKPAAKPEARRQAFGRAVDALLTAGKVAVIDERAWIVTSVTNGTMSRPSDRDNRDTLL